MKKQIILFLALLALQSCGSESENNPDLDFDKGYMNFKLVDFFNFTDEDVFVGTQWIEYINNDGSVTHEIQSEVQRVGNNPLFEQDQIGVYIDFTVNNPLQVNQIIPISDITVYFPLPHNNLNYDDDYCSYIELLKQSTTTGFVKITQIDNENGYLYGEFKFENLKKNSSGSGCENYPTQQNFKIIDGTFKAYN